MTDEELQNSQAKLEEMNAKDREYRATLDSLSVDISKLATKSQELALEHRKTRDARAELKIEYNRLHEQVGQELKRRKKVE